MFKNNRTDDNDKIQRRAEILFDYPKSNKNKKKEVKLLGLGKSAFDNDDDDEANSINNKNTSKIKSELEALTDDKYNKSERKSRKDRTPEEEEEILDLMYPSMKNTGKKNDKNKIPENIDNEETERIASADMNNIKNKTNTSSEKIDNTIFSDNARKKARSFIQKAEKFEPNAYRDTKGVWTIGYGHTKGVKPGDKITEDEAEKLYAEDFKIHSEPLKHVKIPLNDNEKAALASLIFNIGEPQFKNSTVLRKLNNGDKQGAAEAFKLFCKESKTKIIDGKPVKKLEFSQGLYNRRVKEAELFLTPDE